MRARPSPERLFSLRKAWLRQPKTPEKYAPYTMKSNRPSTYVFEISGMHHTPASRTPFSLLWWAGWVSSPLPHRERIYSPPRLPIRYLPKLIAIVALKGALRYQEDLVGDPTENRTPV